MLLCEPAAGVVWMEAVGNRAAQEARAGSQSCTGLQRPAAEGRRDVHPHICRSHERSHNEPNATQPRASGFVCVFNKCHVISDIKFECNLFNTACGLQRSRHIQRVVKRCAMRWKRRALCKPGRGQEVRGQPQKKSVTFCLPGLNRVSPFDSVAQEAGDGALSKL